MHYFLRNSKKKAYLAHGSSLNDEDEIRFSNVMEELLNFSHIGDAANIIASMKDAQISIEDYKIIRVNKEEMNLKKLV